ncbi:MAG: hypothetical protein MJZ61_08165 [Bacteroidales bacterium]|nr:hypothetical protein [Bacteroidales bacterium]
MKVRLLLILLMIICARLSVVAQDPFCHIDVVSGSPAWFYFNTASDYANGKTLYYNTVVKIQYTKQPNIFDIYMRAASDRFDGDGVLPVSCVWVKAESATYNNPSRNFFVATRNEERPLTNSSDGTFLMHCAFDNLRSPDQQPSFYVNLRFAIRPDADYTFSSLSGDIYSLISNLYIITWYP